MDKLGHMRALVTVAKLGSFSAAARELGVTPGMMSKQVKQLEDELDVRLLHRTTRGVSVTDAGELYLARAVDILSGIERMESDVVALAASPRGVLRISCPPSFGTHILTPVIAEFARQHGGLSVELGLQDDEPNVIASRLDLIFRLGKLRDSSLVARQVGEAPFVLCAAPGFVAAHGSPQSLTDLSRFNCIVDGSIQSESVWQFEHNGRLIDQAVSGNFSSLSTEAVIEAAVAGLGFSYVPRYAITDELASGEVFAVEVPGMTAITLPVYALYASREHVAAKVTDFLEFFRHHVDATSGMLPLQNNVTRKAKASPAEPASDLTC